MTRSDKILLMQADVVTRLMRTAAVVRSGFMHLCIDHACMSWLYADAQMHQHFMYIYLYLDNKKN